ncbi:hypothetical protein [Piscirickettsia litoralis]|uniref:Phytase-like domain-containing protein n=1 Tax=Piscirickettsia litoralis TaxID=1891921 RepID=A0ABX3A481_9GAMM|nr:hypothetical protein [Piscirickettsia litoralis]ODN43669.1 hypothetical protein BGC07_13115 [Piscirickettsia litoralis]
MSHQTLNSDSSHLKNHKGAIYAFELRPGGGHCSSMAQYDKNCRFINAINTNYEDSSGLEYDAASGKLYTLHNVYSHINSVQSNYLRIEKLSGCNAQSRTQVCYQFSDLKSDNKGNTEGIAIINGKTIFLSRDGGVNHHEVDGRAITAYSIK